MQMILAIAAGGAIGAVMRYGINAAVTQQFGAGFPFGILAVNILGSVMMGAVIGLFAHIWQPAAELKAFITVGLLGAFTTFSTFSLDVFTLYERGAILTAGVYIAASVILSIVGLFAGLLTIRQITG